MGIIPARFGSIRFPGKPLVNIEGKTMIQRVYEQCYQAKLLDKVIVATDCPYIFKTITDIGGNVVLSKQEHENGTSRCAEAYTLSGETFDYIINIQGDEPFINPNQIDELVTFVVEQKPEIATQINKEFQSEFLENPNIVKVVTPDGLVAKNFTRKAIPLTQNHFYKHIGLYAFKVDVLQKIVLLKLSANEIKERLEQLRWLDNNFNILLQKTEYQSKSIDRLEDLLRL